MATITIDGTEYDTDKLPDEVKSQLGALQEIDRQMKTLSNQMAIQNMARAYIIPQNNLCVILN